MSRFTICLVLYLIGSSAAEDKVPLPKVESGPAADCPPEATTEPAIPPVDLTAVVADVREVNVKLETVCRMQYGDTQCGMLRRTDVKLKPAIGALP